jgi:hypothetical protein
MPDRFRMAIVHYAVALAREDRGDYQGAASARQQGDAVVALMVDRLIDPQHQAPSRYAAAVGDDM